MPEPNFENRTLYHGDNLEFLRGMNSETVHLIATDPPFNKNRDFHSDPNSLARDARFSDRWKWDKDVHSDWTESIIDDWPQAWDVINTARSTFGDDMSAFLCWLGVRLMEMRRILRPDGSIFLHIDHTAHAYVKCLMDAIFGAKNFRNEIVWCYTGPSNTKRWFPRKHDTILFYSKGKEWTFNRDAVRVPYSDKYVKRFSKRYKEQAGKSTIFRAGHDTDRNQELARKGKLPEDWWTGFSPVGRKKKENTGYPTQKPVDLYERIIAAGSNEGDFVLDPFCGCNTTPIAAERLKRKWVGMDIWDEALRVVMERLENDTILRTNERHHVVLPQVLYKTEPPIRTDDNETAAPSFELKSQRAREPWEKLKHQQMRSVLAYAQKSDEGVICAGCGRVLELEFMQLDHIMPRTDGGANHILNRVLLCGPCNRRKRNHLTLSGLVAQNRKKDVGWMQNEARAKMARQKARERAEWVRDEFDSEECKALIAGDG